MKDESTLANLKPDWGCLCMWLFFVYKRTHDIGISPRQGLDKGNIKKETPDCTYLSE